MRSLLAVACMVLLAALVIADGHGDGLAEHHISDIAQSWYPAGNNTNFGRRIAPIGDFNGDGTHDFIISEPGAGKAWVFFGGYPLSMEDMNMVDSNSVVTLAVTLVSQNFGTDVNGVGDINGDGCDDLAVGAMNWSKEEEGDYSWNLNSYGRLYVIYGCSLMAGDYLNVEKNLGDHGFSIIGAGPDNWLGTSVSGGGDFNGDGIADIAVSAPFSTGFIGSVYVIYGRAAGNAWPKWTNLAGGFSKDYGHMFYSPSAWFEFGHNVILTHDFTGDQKADLVVGSTHYSTWGDPDYATGAVHVIYGDDGLSSWSTKIEFGYNNGKKGVKIHNWPGKNNLGAEIAIGDVTGDGKMDILAQELTNDIVILEFEKNVPAMTASANGFENVVDWIDAGNGFRYNIEDEIANADRRLARYLDAGDLNGDGIDDIIWGNPTTHESAGVVTVVFGGSVWPSDTGSYDVDDLHDDDGVMIVGPEEGQLGFWSLAAIGPFSDGMPKVLAVSTGMEENNMVYTVKTDSFASDAGAPDGWSCDAMYYGDGSCDCGCGIPDMDCDAEWKRKNAKGTGCNEESTRCTSMGYCVPDAWPGEGKGCWIDNWADGKNCDCACSGDAVDPDCVRAKPFNTMAYHNWNTGLHIATYVDPVPDTTCFAYSFKPTTASSYTFVGSNCDDWERDEASGLVVQVFSREAVQKLFDISGSEYTKLQGWVRVRTTDYRHSTKSTCGTIKSTWSGFPKSWKRNSSYNPGW